MLHLADESDDELDQYVPTIIVKPKEAVRRTNKTKYKGVFQCGKKFKAQIQTGVCT